MWRATVRFRAGAKRLIMRGKKAEEDDEFELDSGWCGADPITKQVRTNISLSVPFLILLKEKSEFDVKREMKKKARIH